ncbi:hypothetical protein N7468_004659 [Penicillium chermesinum]|uniref:Uncharacterized protein n=1 Tax=Penicillium chermesinum TaxID=63820 RepID=A0A9W9TSR8_9EURO|nr:uncharacterized protein N7468_004659 [Penicillium chermesinum]KAJ5240040.1 hypothetical protein N7468_004659 [Penicillium chermesinum]
MFNGTGAKILPPCNSSATLKRMDLTIEQFQAQPEHTPAYGNVNGEGAGPELTRYPVSDDICCPFERTNHYAAVTH